MNFTKQNSQAINEVLVADMQKRLLKNHEEYVLENATPGELPEYDEEYDIALRKMIDKILRCNSLDDVDDLILEYCDIFTTFDDYGILATTQGTLNYIISLLIKKDLK
jgi:hypothetical protein